MRYARLQRRLLSMDRTPKRVQTCYFQIDPFQGSHGPSNTLITRQSVFLGARESSFGFLDILIQVKEIEGFPQTKRENVPYDLFDNVYVCGR